MSYFGWQETLKNKEVLDEMNSKFDITIDLTKNPKNDLENRAMSEPNKELFKQEVFKSEFDKQKGKMSEVKSPVTESESETEKTQKNTPLTQNVLQNISTQDIMKIKGNLK